VSPQTGDFTLRPDTPASALGFRPFSLADAGCGIKKPKTAKLPRPPDTYAPAPARKHITVNQGFEDADVGQGPPDWVVFANNRRDLVTVVDDVAASGKRALRVNDQLPSYEPHFYIDVERTQGPVSFSFDLRLGDGAQPGFEMRDTDPQYTAGPGVSVGADRNLRSRGKVLMQLPLSTWVNIKLETTVGTGAARDYTIRVKIEGEEERVFDGLHYPAGFRKLTWLGFVSQGTVGSVFELDNLILTP